MPKAKKWNDKNGKHTNLDTGIKAQEKVEELRGSIKKYKLRKKEQKASKESLNILKIKSSIIRIKQIIKVKPIVEPRKVINLCERDIYTQYSLVPLKIRNFL